MKLAGRQKIQRYLNKLTPEGWVFLVVLMFITLGSIMRNVNLLVLMAGMMVVSLLLNWRLAVHRLRTLSAKRRLPKQLNAGELISFQWTCENRSDRIAAWNLMLSDAIERAPDDLQNSDIDPVRQKFETDRWYLRLFGEILQRLGKSQSNERLSDVGLVFPSVAAGQSEVRSYRVFFGQRGKYTVGPALLSTTFPFGLIVSKILYPDVETFFVGPELGELEPTWEKRIQSTAAGSETVKRRRAIEEDEFYALRPWRSGDSQKNIHWRTTAKLGEPFVKQYDQQNNRDFALLLDLYCEDGDESGVRRSERAISFAATALTQIKNDVQGQVALGVCGVATEICASRTQQGILANSNRRLAVAQPCSDPETFEAIHQVAKLVSNGTPVYIISTRPQSDVLAELDTESKGETKQLRMLKSYLSLVRWLEVDSSEFNAMFKLEQDPDSKADLRALSDRWSREDFERNSENDTPAADSNTVSPVASDVELSRNEP